MRSASGETRFFSFMLVIFINTSVILKKLKKSFVLQKKKYFI